MLPGLQALVVDAAPTSPLTSDSTTLNSRPSGQHVHSSRMARPQSSMSIVLDSSRRVARAGSEGSTTSHRSSPAAC